MENIEIDGIDMDNEDDWDFMIVKLYEVNTWLIEKLEWLEDVVSTTVNKYTSTKWNYSSHREWDADHDEETKEKSKKI